MKNKDIIVMVVLLIIISISGTMLVKAISEGVGHLEKPLMTGECQFDDMEEAQPCYYFKK